MTPAPGQIDPRLHAAIESDDPAALADLLRAEPALRDPYLDLLILDGHLTFEISSAAVTVSPIAPKPRGAAQRTPGVYRITPIALALAAALLLAATAVAIYVFVINPKSEIPDPKSGGPPIATLIESTGTVIANDDIASPGSEYAAGVYSLDTGDAEFQLRSGANLRITGGTRLHVSNSMSAMLSAGSVSIHCPPSAVGYTVHLPGGVKVVDLGTRFRVAVDDAGHHTVRVSEGRVRIDTPVASRIVSAPMLAQLDSTGAIAVSEPAPFAIDFTVGAGLPDGWIWDSPGQATHTLVEDRGLNVRTPAHHNAWDQRGLAPIVYADRPLPETYTIETELELNDGPVVMGSIALYDTASKNFALSLGLVREPAVGVIVALEGPGLKHASVPAGATRVVLRLERTADDRFVASYRLPNESPWRSVGEIEADAVPGDPSGFCAALMSKAWHNAPGAVSFRNLNITNPEDAEPKEIGDSLPPTP